MNQRKARKVALGIAAKQVQAYIEAGQPHSDFYDGARGDITSEVEADKVVAELVKIQHALEARADR